jgi:hypothetical protein
MILRDYALRFVHEYAAHGHHCTLLLKKNEICTFEYQKKSLVLEYVYMFHISLSSLGRKLVCFWAIQKLISDSKWESYTSILFVKFCFFCIAQVQHSFIYQAI